VNLYDFSINWAVNRLGRQTRDRLLVKKTWSCCQTASACCSASGYCCGPVVVSWPMWQKFGRHWQHTCRGHWQSCWPPTEG